MPTREEINAMHQASQLVRIATGEKIVRQYLQDRDRSFAMSVASAIVNDLTGGTSPDPAFKRFEKENATLITDIVTKLRNDEELKDIITQTVGVMTTIKIAAGDVSIMADPGKMLEHLKDLGLVTTEGKSPRPETYLPLVTAYCKKYVPGMASRQQTSSPSGGRGCAGMLILLLTIPTTLIVLVTAVLE
jgi:hypothetical protein